MYLGLSFLYVWIFFVLYRIYCFIIFLIATALNLASKGIDCPFGTYYLLSRGWDVTIEIPLLVLGRGFCVFILPLVLLWFRQVVFLYFQLWSTDWRRRLSAWWFAISNTSDFRYLAFICFIGGPWICLLFSWLGSADTMALLFNHIINKVFGLLFFLTVLPSHTGLKFVLKELIIVLLILVFRGVAPLGRKRASKTADTRILVDFTFLQYFGIPYLL